MVAFYQVAFYARCKKRWSSNATELVGPKICFGHYNIYAIIDIITYDCMTRRELKVYFRLNTAERARPISTLVP